MLQSYVILDLPGTNSFNVIIDTYCVFRIKYIVEIGSCSLRFEHFANSVWFFFLWVGINVYGRNWCIRQELMHTVGIIAYGNCVPASGSSGESLSGVHCYQGNGEDQATGELLWTHAGSQSVRSGLYPLSAYTFRSECPTSKLKHAFSSSLWSIEFCDWSKYLKIDKTKGYYSLAVFLENWLFWQLEFGLFIQN